MFKNVTNMFGESYFRTNVKMNGNEDINSDRDNWIYSVKKGDFLIMKKSLSMSNINALSIMKSETQYNEVEINQKYCRPTTAFVNEPQKAKTKIVSMAESVYDFHKDTVGCFHTGASTFYTDGYTTDPCRCAEIPKRAITPESKPQFEAEIAPKHVLEKPETPAKPPVLKTTPLYWKFNYKSSKSQDYVVCDTKTEPLKATEDFDNAKPLQRLGPICAKPFSLAQHDEEIKRRKEEYIRKQTEEERIVSKTFKAPALTENVRKVMQNALCKASSSTTSFKNKENHYKFEARLPLVLYKKPFKPVLKPVNMKLDPFVLATEKRAEERKKFEKHLKVKEEENEKLREKIKTEVKQIEEKQTAKLRAKLVHSAKPFVPSGPFIPEKSDKMLTVPKTPKFVRRRN